LSALKLETLFSVGGPGPSCLPDAFSFSVQMKLPAVVMAEEIRTLPEGPERAVGHAGLTPVLGVPCRRVAVGCTRVTLTISRKFREFGCRKGQQPYRKGFPYVYKKTIE
jgi:hypothetical protein